MPFARNSVKYSLAFKITLSCAQNPFDLLHFHISRRPDFPRREITNKYTVVVTSHSVKRRESGEKKGSPIKRGVNSTVIVHGRGRLFPIGVTERGQEIVSNWRAVRGLKIPRSSRGFLFLSLSSSPSFSSTGR